MFVLLLTKVIKVENVKDVGEFLIEIMPLMFIPAGVGLMASWGELQGFLVPLLCNYSIHHFYCYFCDWKSNGFYDGSKGKNKQKEPESKGEVKKDGKYSS